MTKDQINLKNKINLNGSKVLFILHIPPPIDGAAMIGKFIHESELINSNIESDYINLTSSFNLDHIGKYKFAKFKVVLNILKKVFIALKNKKYHRCYMTLTSNGVGLYKDFLIILLLKIFRCKIIYHFHNKGVLKSSKKWYNHLIYKITFKNAECILLSPILYSDISPYFLEDRVFILNNGIQNLTKNYTSKKKTNKSNNCVNFLFLSNLMKEKGVFELLQACEKLKSKNLLFTCEFIGAWSDITEVEFKNKVNTLGLQKHVLIHGKKYDTERVLYLQNADVFVLPTYYHNECFPLVILEAMQFGLPVISTPEGAISEIVIEGETGLLIEQKNSKTLAEAMHYLISNPKQRIRMGENGKNRYETFYTIEKFERRLLQILKTSTTGYNEYNLEYEQKIKKYS